MRHIKRINDSDLNYPRIPSTDPRAYLLIYGGENTRNPPFSVGDRLRQKWRVASDGYLTPDGREMHQFMGMKGEMMLLKTLNEAAAYSEDTTSPEVLRMSKKAGYRPEVGKIMILHYMYADRYVLVD